MRYAIICSIRYAIICSIRYAIICSIHYAILICSIHYVITTVTVICIHFDQFDHVYIIYNVIIIIIYNVILQLVQFLFIYEIILIALFASNNVINNKLINYYPYSILGIGSWL